jgi:transposase-like protein
MARKKYTDEFKKQVGEAAAKGDKTFKQLSKQFDVHTTLVSNWKKDFLSGKFDDHGIDDTVITDDLPEEGNGQEEKIKSLMKDLISLGEGWSDCERWIYTDDNFIMYEHTWFDDVDILMEEIEELIADGKLEESDYDSSKFDVDDCWKAEYILYLDFGTINYVTLNIAEGDSKLITSILIEDCDDEDLLIDWLENAIENEWSPEGD